MAPIVALGNTLRIIKPVRYQTARAARRVREWGRPGGRPLDRAGHRE
jgi:hypothetical protein